jgi:hypothetical protein
MRRDGISVKDLLDLAAQLLQLLVDPASIIRAGGNLADGFVSVACLACAFA